MSGVKPTMEDVIDMNLDQLKERATSLNIKFASTVTKVQFQKLLLKEAQPRALVEPQRERESLEYKIQLAKLEAEGLASKKEFMKLESESLKRKIKMEAEALEQKADAEADALRQKADAETKALKLKTEALRQMAEAEAEALVQNARAEQTLKQEAFEQEIRLNSNLQGQITLLKITLLLRREIGNMNCLILLHVWLKLDNRLIMVIHAMCRHIMYSS